MTKESNKSTDYTRARIMSGNSPHKMLRMVQEAALKKQKNVIKPSEKTNL